MNCMEEKRVTTLEEDESTAAAVLQQLLDLYPARLTLDELRREFGCDPDDFAELDAVERAVHDLHTAGLLHRGDGFVTPSRAAVRFSELMDR